MVSILMVAEKPSIATSIAQALSPNKSVENLCKSPPCYEFYGHYEGKESFMRITSVTGHVYSTDFPPEYQSWDKVEPVVLFNAPIHETYAKSLKSSNQLEMLFQFEKQPSP